MPAVLSIVKLATNLVVCAGTSKIVNDTVRNNTVQETLIDQIKVFAGSAVIGSMVYDHTSEYVDTKIDGVAEKISKFRNRKETEEEVEK